MKPNNKFSLLVMVAVAVILQGCGGLTNKVIKNVKESYTSDYPDVTLGDTIKYFAPDASWSGKMGNLQDGPTSFLVTVTGTFDIGKVYSNNDDSKAELAIHFIAEGKQNMPFTMQGKNGDFYDEQATRQFIKQMKSVYSDAVFFSKIDVTAENLVKLLAENYKKIWDIGKKGNAEYERGNYEKMDKYFAEGRKIYKDSKRIAQKLVSPELSLSERDKDAVEEAFGKIEYIYDECGMSQNGSY